MTITSPLTSLTAIHNWVSAEKTASAIPPVESVRLFVDATWMAGIPNSERFSRRAENFLDKLEKGEWKRADRLPKNLSDYFSKLSPDDLEKINGALPLVKGNITTRPDFFPFPFHNRRKIPKSSPRLRQLAGAAQWGHSTALIWGGKEYIAEAVSPSGKLILRKEWATPCSSNFEEFLILDNDKRLAEREKHQPIPTPDTISQTILPGVNVIGKGIEWGLFVGYLLPQLHKFWRQGKLPPIKIVVEGKRDSKTAELRTVRYWLLQFPPFLLKDLKKIILTNKPDGDTGADYEDGVITIFPRQPNLNLGLILLHELMHHVAARIFGADSLLEHAEWAEAIRKDERYVSRYAFLTNRNEDFAETATLYFLSHRGVLNNYRSWVPNRFRILDTIFQDCFKKKPPSLPTSTI